jgi:anti-sigma-K factor RskA
MITERHEELATLHALGLLDDVERSAFEAELSGSGELRALVRSFGAATSTLALSVPQMPAPTGLKANIMAALEAETNRPTEPAETASFPLTRYLTWAAAATLAVTTTWLATQNVSLRTETEALRTRQRLVQIAYETAQNQLAERSLLAEHLINDLGSRLQRSENLARLKVSALASLAGNTAEARAIAVWDPYQQAGLLTFEKLPAIAAEQDYQIWVIDPAYQNPINGGVFHVEKEGGVSLAFRPDQPVTKATAFAISLEKKGGVPKAEGPIVLLGKVPSI